MPIFCRTLGVDCSNCRKKIKISLENYTFEEVSADFDRSMGVERCHECNDAFVECPKCHKVFTKIILYEYPEGGLDCVILE